MLSSAELAEMRALQEETFDLVAVIMRPGDGGSDGAGGGAPAQPVTVATVPCRLTANKTADSERVAAGAIQGQTVWRLTVPQGTDLRHSDTVTIGTRSFEVVSVWGPHSHDTALVALVVGR